MSHQEAVANQRNGCCLKSADFHLAASMLLQIDDGLCTL